MCDINGFTVAMYLADNKLDIPVSWHHNPEI